ncbi:MAG: hypothetical protein M5U09_09910 [Gammaproteobacteria bacterium]|nr:hypothetical protein [Gammaproteobacteria bacterium]
MSPTRGQRDAGRRQHFQARSRRQRQGQCHAADERRVKDGEAERSADHERVHEAELRLRGEAVGDDDQRRDVDGGAEHVQAEQGADERPAPRRDPLALHQRPVDQLEEADRRQHGEDHLVLPQRLLDGQRCAAGDPDGAEGDAEAGDDHDLQPLLAADSRPQERRRAEGADARQPHHDVAGELAQHRQYQHGEQQPAGEAHTAASSRRARSRLGSHGSWMADELRMAGPWRVCSGPGLRNGKVKARRPASG